MTITDIVVTCGYSVWFVRKDSVVPQLQKEIATMTVSAAASTRQEPTYHVHDCGTMGKRGEPDELDGVDPFVIREFTESPVPLHFPPRGFHVVGSLSGLPEIRA